MGNPLPFFKVKDIDGANENGVIRESDSTVTPETALQGYFFYDNNGKLPSFSEKQLSRYLFFAGRNKADMFLSAAEYDEYGAPIVTATPTPVPHTEYYEQAPDTDSIEGWPQGPKIEGESAILVDISSSFGS